jgi:uncharacterized protein YlxW (UPF0749 family)
MRKILVVLMAAFMVSAAVPVMAAEMSKADKDQCLLYSKSCMNEVDSLQQKMKKLNQEINKGTRVYSPEELKKLNEKLKEAEDLMDKMSIE